MINSVVAFFTAIVTFFSGCFSGFVDAVFFPEVPQTESVEFAKSLGNGWNLGNALDACEMGSDKKMGLESETCWGNPYTTKEMIEAVKAAGFGTVRIPITWAQHLDENYVIDKEWLARVKQIVDWVLECGMYAIINVHHDDTFWLVTDKEHEENATAVLTAIWSQVSEYFKDYDERLIFETMNEPRVIGAETEWSGIPEHYEVVNNLNLAALKAIRESGGKNESRFVSISTYAARCETEPVCALKLPDDPHVLVSTHCYYSTAHRSEFLDCENKLTLREKYEMYEIFRNIYKIIIKKGYGVVLGEFGWTDRVNLDNLAERAEYFITTANKFGIPCIVWDNGSDFRLFDRTTHTLEFPNYIKP